MGKVQLVVKMGGLILPPLPPQTHNLPVNQSAVNHDASRVQNTPQNTPQNTLQNIIQNTSQNTPQNTVQNMVQNTVQNRVQVRVQNIPHTSATPSVLVEQTLPAFRNSFPAQQPGPRGINPNVLHASYNSAGAVHLPQSYGTNIWQYPNYQPQLQPQQPLASNAHYYPYVDNHHVNQDAVQHTSAFAQYQPVFNDAFQGKFDGHIRYESLTSNIV